MNAESRYASKRRRRALIAAVTGAVALGIAMPAAASATGARTAPAGAQTAAVAQAGKTAAHHGRVTGGVAIAEDDHGRVTTVPAYPVECGVVPATPVEHGHHGVPAVPAVPAKPGKHAVPAVPAKPGKKAARILPGRTRTILPGETRHDTFPEVCVLTSDEASTTTAHAS